MQMKAIEQYFHVVRFIRLYEVVLSFHSLDEAIEQFFYVMLVLTFE